MREYGTEKGVIDLASIGTLALGIIAAVVLGVVVAIGALVYSVLDVRKQ